MVNPTKLLLITLIWFCKSTFLPKLHYLLFKNAAAIAEGHDYVTSKGDEGFTLPDPILRRSWSLIQNQT